MRFLIIDDHPMLRDAVAAVLRRFDPDATVLQAADGEQGLALAGEHADLAAAWVDLRMAGLAGIATVEQLRRRYPGLPVIVLSSSEDPDDVRRALQAGARGYCPQVSRPDHAASGTAPGAGRRGLRAAVHGAAAAGAGRAGARLGPDQPAAGGGCTCCANATPTRTSAACWACRTRPSRAMSRPLFRTLKVVHSLQAGTGGRARGGHCRLLSHSSSQSSRIEAKLSPSGA